MGKKLTLEEAKERLVVISPNVEILSDVYINANTKLKCGCLIDGHIWYPTWASLSQGYGCPMCGKKSMVKKQSLDINYIKNKLKDINPNIEILSDEYINNTTKLKCKCLIDENQWMTTWSVLARGGGCPKCGIKSMTNKSRLTTKEIKSRLMDININIEILSDEYTNSSAKLKCRCLIDNYEWHISWSDLSKGHGCPKCSNMARVTIDSIKEHIAHNNQNIEVLASSYTPRKGIECRCLVDGYVWYPIWSNLSKGHGCPRCAASELQGVYIETLAERNKNKWLKEYAVVYLLQCVNNNEMFYKIGITKKDTNKRFKTKKTMPYEYTTIHKIETNLYNAVYLEKKLHELNKEFSYTPKIKFGGYTECFSEIKIFENVLE